MTYQFIDGVAPSCLQSADSNADQKVDIADAVFLIQYLFHRGASPPEPFAECGPASSKGLTCDSFAPCE